MRTAVSLAGLLAMSGVARADHSGYGDRILVADGISAGLVSTGLAVGAATDNDAWSVAGGAVGLLGLTLAAPIMHGMHDQGLRALGSFGLRSLAATPLYVGGLDGLACNRREGDCSEADRAFHRMVALSGALYVAVSLVDAFLIAPDGEARLVSFGGTF